MFLLNAWLRDDKTRLISAFVSCTKKDVSLNTLLSRARCLKAPPKAKAKPKAKEKAAKSSKSGKGKARKSGKAKAEDGSTPAKRVRRSK